MAGCAVRVPPREAGHPLRKGGVIWARLGRWRVRGAGAQHTGKKRRNMEPDEAWGG
jgi:hypothetical protein